MSEILAAVAALPLPVIAAGSAVAIAAYAAIGFKFADFLVRFEGSIEWRDYE